MFIDISKAYLHADVLNDSIYVEMPGEMNMPNTCGRLLRALYGTRQAARAWEEEYTKTLKGVGFQRGKCNPCVYYHPRRDVRGRRNERRPHVVEHEGEERAQQVLQSHNVHSLSPERNLVQMCKKMRLGTAGGHLLCHLVVWVARLALVVVSFLKKKKF